MNSLLGGTIGEVSVDWSIDTAASNASRDTDYVADGATLTFLTGISVRGQSCCDKYHNCYLSPLECMYMSFSRSFHL